jgi:hypothetical protein
MRAKIWDIVQVWILQRKNFGLDDFSIGTEKPDIERALYMFEAALMGVSEGKRENQVHHPQYVLTFFLGREADIADWRIRTLRCASLLKLECSRPKKTAAYIKKFMGPLWPCSPAVPGGAEAADDKLLILVEKMCKDAFNFSMLLRASRDLYRCELPAPRSRLGEDSAAQAQEPSEDSSLTEQDIAYAMAPALVKYPLTDPKRRLVLEKAHVIVF